jgi:SpoVK/Ycf46/Vps4 family AAA+-type ATPase
MTANNPERLDPALVRPGRVDRIIKFDYPRKKEVKDAFDALTVHAPTDAVDPTTAFNQFYKYVGNLQISMAAIVDFLFLHPSNYMDKIEELTEHNKLLHEIVNSKSESMYK